MTVLVAFFYYSAHRVTPEKTQVLKTMVLRRVGVGVGGGGNVCNEWTQKCIELSALSLFMG